MPPAFLVCAGAGDRVHAIWALEYYEAMLSAGVPNVELHLYGNGRHPGDPLPDGSRSSGGLTDRNNIPLGTWQYRFIDWARDLGFLQKPGIETRAAKDVAAYVAKPPRPSGQRRGAAGRDGQPATPPPAPPGAATDRAVSAPLDRILREIGPVRKSPGASPLGVPKPLAKPRPTGR